MPKQKKEPISKKQYNPFEPKKEARKTAVYPRKKSSSIFEKDKEDVHDEKDEFIEDHEELGETEEQIEDEMRTGMAEADVYTEEGRHSREEEEDEEDIEDIWQRAWSEGAAGRGRHGKFEEEKPVVKGKKVKETVKGIKKKK